MITRATVVDLMALYTPLAVREGGGDQAAHETIEEAVRDTNLCGDRSGAVEHPVGVRRADALTRSRGRLGRIFDTW